MDAAQYFAIKIQQIRPAPGFQRHHARLHIETACNQFVPADDFEQFLQLGFRPYRLQHQLQSAAAGQTKTRRLFGGHPIGNHLRCTAHHLVGLDALNQIILDAAPRNRADNMAVVANHQHRTDRSRRRTPGPHHRRQGGTMPRIEPGNGTLDDFGIYTIHNGCR